MDGAPAIDFYHPPNEPTISDQTSQLQQAYPYFQGAAQNPGSSFIVSPTQRHVESMSFLPTTSEMQQPAQYASNPGYAAQVVHPPDHWSQPPLVHQSTAGFNAPHSHCSQFSTYLDTSVRGPSSTSGSDGTVNNSINTLDAHPPPPYLSAPHENHTFAHVNYHHQTTHSQPYTLQHAGDLSRDRPTSPVSPLSEYTSASVTSPAQPYTETVSLDVSHSGQSSVHLSPDVVTQLTNSHISVRDNAFISHSSSPTYPGTPHRRKSTYSSDESESSLDTISSPPSKPKGKSSMACHACRRRKRKCDGTKPVCGSCKEDAKRKNPACADEDMRPCSWDTEVRRRGKGRKTQVLLKKAGKEAESFGLKGDGTSPPQPLLPQTTSEHTARVVAEHALPSPSYPNSRPVSLPRQGVQRQLAPKTTPTLVVSPDASGSQMSLSPISPVFDITSGQQLREHPNPLTLMQAGPPQVNMSGSSESIVDRRQHHLHQLEIHAPIPISPLPVGHNNLSYHQQHVVQAPVAPHGLIVDISPGHGDTWHASHTGEGSFSFASDMSVQYPSPAHSSSSTYTVMTPSLSSSCSPSSPGSVTSTYIQGSPIGFWPSRTGHLTGPHPTVLPYSGNIIPNSENASDLSHSQVVPQVSQASNTHATAHLVPSANRTETISSMHHAYASTHVRYGSVDTLSSSYSHSGEYYATAAPEVQMHQAPIAQPPDTRTVRPHKHKHSRTHDSALWGALGEESVVHWTPSPPHTAEEDSERDES